MNEDVIAMQQAAEQRVKRMQERNRRLLENGPTFGAGLLRQVPPPTPCGAEKPKAAATGGKEGQRLLPLLLLLVFLQGGDELTLLILLAYLM